MPAAGNVTAGLVESNEGKVTRFITQVTCITDCQGTQSATLNLEYVAAVLLTIKNAKNRFI